MPRFMRGVVICIGLILVGLLLRGLQGRAQLLVSYSSSGIQRLSYNGTVLEDLSAFPADTFHIWHMKLTDLQGNLLSGPQYGWGENNTGKSWDSQTNTWTYRFVWGSVTVQYAQTGSSLNMTVTEMNRVGSGVILDGASIYPLVLHFPTLPNGFNSPNYPQLAFNTIGPSVTVADYVSAEVVSVVPNSPKPLYSGFLPAGTANSYTAFIGSTTPDGLATFQPHNDRPVLPGQTDTFVVSLRFAPSGTTTNTIAADAYTSWAQTWPPQLKWTDRRPIGTAYLASSATASDITRPAGYPNNPRRYFNDSDPSHFNVGTSAGLLAFQARVLQQAATDVQNMTRLGAQGAITWDIEGQQYPQSTSYVCAPDSIAQVAPEMETVVSDSNSRYHGMKLDDAYFKTMIDAGFRVGVCVRPQHFAINADGTARQTFVSNSSVLEEITRKIKFAHDRWGATLFYIDSSVDSNGAPLDASVFQQLGRAFPDSLLIPEESTPKHYAYTSPFKTFLFHGDLGTDSSVYAYYPNAFSAILINDVDAASLAGATPALTASVKAGDVLMGHIGYWQANNPTIVSIYQNAGRPPVTTPTPPPTPTPDPTPPPVAAPVSGWLVQIQSPTVGATLSGIVSVIGQVLVNLDAAGSYLMVDGQEVGTTRATASPYTYALDTRLFAAGTHLLQLWAHSQNNEILLSSPVAVTISQSAANPIPDPTPTPTPVPAPVAPMPTPSGVVLTYPVSGQALSGVVQVTGRIGQTLDAAGCYLIIDGAQFGYQRFTSPPYIFTVDTSLLSSGPHSFQLWAHDTNNDTLLSTIVSVTVTK